jgi:hypothetical protein
MVDSRFHSTPQDSFAFEDVFARYSKLSMTISTDKTVAISGLQNRLGGFYKTQSTYGIIHHHLHKNLLWQRSGKEKMQRISNPEVVPSWSWMAYKGEIRYGTSDLHGLNWEPIELTIACNLRSVVQEEHILKAPLGRIVQS